MTSNTTFLIFHPFSPLSRRLYCLAVCVFYFNLYFDANKFHMIINTNNKTSSRMEILVTMMAIFLSERVSLNHALSINHLKSFCRKVFPSASFKYSPILLNQ